MHDLQAADVFAALCIRLSALFKIVAVCVQGKNHRRVMAKIMATSLPGTGAFQKF